MHVRVSSPHPRAKPQLFANPRRLRLHAVVVLAQAKGMAQVAQSQHLLWTWPGSPSSPKRIICAACMPQSSMSSHTKSQSCLVGMPERALEGLSTAGDSLAEGVAPGASGPMWTAGMPTEYTVILR